MGPWRTSTLPVRTVQATRDVPRSGQPSWSKVWESLSWRVRNALGVSEVSPSVYPVRLAEECWWTILGLTHTEYRRCKPLKSQTRSRGALWQSTSALFWETLWVGFPWKLCRCTPQMSTNKEILSIQLLKCSQLENDLNMTNRVSQQHCL